MMDCAIFCSSKVFPAFGGETISPRCPLPIGATKSIIRGDRSSELPDPVSSLSLESGNNGVMYLENTYVAEGQDGNHYNQSINTGTNTAVSADVANALYYMSDHLPVSMIITLGGTVGYNDLNAENIKMIYQAQNKLMELENLYSYGRLSIFDMSGSCLKQFKTKGLNSCTVDLSNLDSGMYIAHLVLENPEYGIAKGQAGVIYDGNDAALMLGGGWISSAPSSVF